MKTKPTASKSELTRLYGVSMTTMTKWLADVPDLNLKRGQKILTPKQLSKVYEFLGEP